MAALSVLENIESNDISAIKIQLKALKVGKGVLCKAIGSFKKYGETATDEIEQLSLISTQKNTRTDKLKKNLNPPLSDIQQDNSDRHTNETQTNDKIEFQQIRKRRVVTVIRYNEQNIINPPPHTDKVRSPLPPLKGENELWKSFKAKLVAPIKWSARLSQKVKFGNKEFLDDFYRVSTLQMRGLGTPGHGKECFSNALDALGGAATLVTIYLDDKAVACAFLLGFKRTFETPSA